MNTGEARLPVKAIAAGLVALYAAALVVGVADGVPPAHGNGEAGPALPPGARLCLRGPGGELVEFTPARNRPSLAASDGGPRGSGTPR